MLILNLGAGKMPPILEKKAREKPRFIVNLDTSYYTALRPEFIEKSFFVWEGKSNSICYCNEDAFTFMERTKLKFDRICIYRLLEHITMDKVLYFIYLLSTVTSKGDLIDVIVPNYELLANMILKEDVNDKGFEAHNILLTTELLNDPSCPHASVWTPARAEYFFELEKRFKINQWASNYEFDGRNIYLRFWAERL
jgi:hypothetical protein